LGHFSSFFGLGSDATRTSAPIAGVKNKEQKKYPQNPNFLFEPMKAIRIQRATYNRVTAMISPSAVEIHCKQTGQTNTPSRQPQNSIKTTLELKGKK
jgi:hypothetical protein